MRSLCPIALLTTAALLWGGTPVAMRFLMLDASSTTAIFARMVPAGLIALALAVFFRTQSLTPAQWLRLTIAAVSGNFAYQIFSGFGIALIPASWTGVLFCLEPVFIAVGAVFFLKERMGPLAIFGLGLAMAGTITLALSGNDVSGQSSFWGVAFIVISSIGWAVYTLLVRPLAQSHGGLYISLLAIVLSTLPTLVFMSPSLFHEMQSFQAPQWLAMGYVSILSTIVAVTCWTVALPHVKSANAAMFLYLQPVVSAVGGMLLLNEILGLWFLAGGFLILLGVFINQMDELRQQPVEEQ
jgi:drug/metabolite transporter (DMT)-like permease